MMKTVFITLNYVLQNSRSTDFFIEILDNSFENLYVIPANEAWYEIPRIKPDTLIIFQKIYTPKEIDSFGATNIILVPMYDDVPHTHDFWIQYKPYKVLCFSKALYKEVTSEGIDAFYIQYYKKPIFTTLPPDKKTSFKAFYWERSKKITWNTIQQLISNNCLEYLHYHYATNIANKNQIRPSENENIKHSITYSDWFDSPEQYTNIVKNSDIYFAPRESEGIGMSFIEALSYGCCVIAFNAPTMNEYITNNIDGFLYSQDENGKVICELPTTFDSVTFQKIRNSSILRANKGYDKWISDIPYMIDFINKPLVNYKPRISFFIWFYRRLYAIIRHFYKKFK